MDPAELEKRTHELMMHFDAMDISAIKDMMSKDVQGVDELSKKWLRGPNAMDDYFRMAGSKLTDIHSELSDAHVKMYGDVGVVTCLVVQSYKFEGQPLTVKAPFTAIYAKEGGDWKLALVHAVGIPES